MFSLTLTSSECSRSRFYNLENNAVCDMQFAFNATNACSPQELPCRFRELVSVLHQTFSWGSVWSQRAS